MSGSMTVAELKAQAKQMRKRLYALGEKVTHSECLERMAHESGHKDWNTCVAALEEAARKGAAQCEWVDEEGTVVPDFDFIGAPLSDTKAHVDAADLDLLVSSRNDSWWIDFANYLDDHGILQGTDGYQIWRFRQAMDTNGWLDIRHGSNRLVVLAYNSSDDPQTVGESARMTADDAIAYERSRSLKVEDRTWALRREPDIEIRVFGNSEETLERFRNSLLIRQIRASLSAKRTSRDEKNEDWDVEIEARIPTGSIWTCARTYGDPFEFWSEGDEITISSFRKVDMVLGFLHHASGRSGQMAVAELVGAFMLAANTQPAS